MGSLLDQINSPLDLKNLSRKDLPRLAQELRERIIEVVSENGGHLASNLGAVELTVALHYVFDSPRDKIIWDVGHQTYAHKLITGRGDRFHTLRRLEGISGFARRGESVHDPFSVGHGGTSISAALGMAEARDLRGEKHKVLAVIGDGSLSTGMALEGLNNAGALKKDLIVILNDNEMSISPNVGALSSYLSRLLTGKFYIRFRKEVENFLRSIPGFGDQMRKMAKGAEESFKAFLTPGILFEELGFKYVGPVKGHDINALIEVLEHTRRINCPTIVHVYTKKGKGYPPAEEDPMAFHGVGPFHVDTGKPKKKGGPITYTATFGKTLVQLAREDEKIIAITAAMPSGTGLDIFKEELPDRFYDVGMAEQHAVTFAAGLAAEGLRPVVAIYSTFLQRAYDQILHDVCLQNLPVTFVLDRAGIVGEDGPTHQGTFDLSYLRSIPNMTIMCPADENELRRMLKTAVESGAPAALRYPRGAGFGVPFDDEIRALEIGKGEILCQGKDVAILAVGNMVRPALEAAQRLRHEGIEAAVANVRFLKPLDKKLILNLAEKAGRLVTVEENTLEGGFGSAVLELLAENNVSDVVVKRIGLPDKFVEHGNPDILRKVHNLTPEGMVATARELLDVKVGTHNNRVVYLP